ncbi:MAG TPA: phosphopantetheine-binding protein [Kribbellaceae bacterium]|nr:phosphopantetheine-binding protein [Kribbellaceae bacterium]
MSFSSSTFEPTSGTRPRPLSTEYAAPATQLERRLADLWSAMLNVSPIGIHDDFFELGGHSLLAAELLDVLDRVFGAAVPARVLYLQPTVAELAAVVERLPAGGPDALRRPP